MPAALATTGASLPSAAPAHAPPAAIEQAPPGMRRCVAADGSVLVTDHACEVQGTKQVVAPKDAPQPAPAASNRPFQIVSVRTCARNQQDLLMGVRDALEAHDANRLAEYYHWAGMSSAQGYQLLDRLAAFSARPLVDVQLTSSEELRSPGPDWPERPARRYEPLQPIPDASDSDPAAEPDPDAPPPPPAKAADLLRVDQLRSDKDMDSQVSYLHLLRNAGCWWLQF